MLGLAHRAVLLAPAEDAFDHRPTRLRHAIAFVPCGASVDGAPTTLAGCGDAVVLRHMRRNVDSAQMGHMVKNARSSEVTKTRIRTESLRTQVSVAGKRNF